MDRAWTSMDADVSPLLTYRGIVPHPRSTLTTAHSCSAKLTVIFHLVAIKWWRGATSVIHAVRVVSRRKGVNLMYHTNAGTKGVRWEVGPEFSLHNTRVSVRA